MPTYEYQCKDCGEVFECFESITSKPKRFLSTECEQCNNRAPVTRLIGAGAGVLFRGSGFYETDYRSESYRQAAKAESDAAAPKKDDKGEKSGKTDTAKTDGAAIAATESKAEKKPAAKKKAAKPKSSES